MNLPNTVRPWLSVILKSLTIAAIVAIASTAALGGGGPHNVLIVGNRASDDSLAVANAYRQARDIPQRNLCLLNIDPKVFREDQSISWEGYFEEIRTPIAEFLSRHPSPETLNFIVLTLDLPLRVQVPMTNATPNAPTHRSLSALLTLLPQEKPAVLVTNTYNRKVGGFSRWLESLPPARRPAEFRLVTVLGGYNRADALSLISRSLAADNSSPDGHFYFLESQHAVGFREAAEMISERGYKATHLDDLTGVTQFDNVMGHFSGGAYSKLTWPHIKSSSIRPGALVDMLQSYGARDLNWRGFAFASHVPLGWWIRAGASGVHGATNEPYAHTFPTSGLLQAMLGNYTSGCNLAESYWSALRQLAWQNIIFGDALCAPYARRAELNFVAHPEEDGQVLLSLKVTMPQGRTVGQARLFINGLPQDNPKLIITPPDVAAPAATASTPAAAAPAADAPAADAPDADAAPDDGRAGEAPAALPTIYRWQVPTEGLTSGYHRARAVVIDDTAAAVESHATVDFQTITAGRLLVLTIADVADQPAAVGDRLHLTARYEGRPDELRTITLMRGLENLGHFDDRGGLQLDTRLLGPGRHELQAVGLDAENRPLVTSRPMLLTLAEPLHVIDAWPGAISGTNPRTLLIYNGPLPYDAADLTAAARFVQGQRTIPATATVDENRLIVAPRVPLAAGPATLTVNLPQSPQRSRDFSQTINIQDDSRLLYVMPEDIHLRSTVLGYVSVNRSGVVVREVRPAMVVVGPVDINEPQRPARWTMPAYEISADLTIHSSVREGAAGHGAGLGVHYQDINNHAFVRVESERVAAYEVVDGKRRQIATWPADGSTTGRIPMSLTVIGRRVTVSLHGRTLGEFMLSETLQEGLPLIDLGAPRNVSAANVEIRRPG